MYYVENKSVVDRYTFQITVGGCTTTVITGGTPSPDSPNPTPP